MWRLQNISKSQLSLQKSLTVAETALQEMPKPLHELSEPELERKLCIGKVTTHMLKLLTLKFVQEDFEWLLPVIFSKSTDPLWPDPGASIEKRVEVEIYGENVRTTLSMIVHKIVACSLAYPRLFVLSPNVRIERRERADSRIHAYEFTQLDFEIRDATSKDVRSFVEEIICELIGNLRRSMMEEIDYLGRYQSLKVPETPFKVYDKTELEKKYSENWESHLTQEISDPVWVTNIPREFYDFENFETGKWDNYDLFVPKYGEILSGAKREWEYNKIAGKMERDGVTKENYQILLRLAKEGKLKPSAGAGIGIERLISWIVGAKHVGETQPFPKIPGIVYDL